MVTGHFLLLSYRFDNAIIDFLNPQVVTFKKMYDSIDHQKNRSGPKSRSEVADYYTYIIKQFDILYKQSVSCGPLWLSRFKS